MQSDMFKILICIMYCEIQEMNVKSVSGEEKQIWNNRYS